jgi:hypothetical protein
LEMRGTEFLVKHENGLEFGELLDRKIHPVWPPLPRLPMNRWTLCLSIRRAVQAGGYKVRA